MAGEGGERDGERVRKRERERENKETVAFILNRRARKANRTERITTAGLFSCFTYNYSHFGKKRYLKWR
jgi:hypothetical protein